MFRRIETYFEGKLIDQYENPYYGPKELYYGCIIQNRPIGTELCRQIKKNYNMYTNSSIDILEDVSYIRSALSHYYTEIQLKNDFQEVLKNIPGPQLENFDIALDYINAVQIPNKKKIRKRKIFVHPSIMSKYIEKRKNKICDSSSMILLNEIFPNKAKETYRKLHDLNFNFE